MSVVPASVAHRGGYGMIETVRVWVSKDDEYVHFYLDSLIMPIPEFQFSMPKL
jgi:hypothetical protein